jgi:hypothetical protein
VAIGGSPEMMMQGESVPLCGQFGKQPQNRRPGESRDPFFNSSKR